MKVAGDLGPLINTATRRYIDANSEVFKSIVPGPKGDKGNTGDHVHHISYQRSKDSLGNEVGPVSPSQKGYTDTYAMWTSQEELPEMYIGEFTVYNGLNTLTAEEQVKFDSIEFGATADQLASEVPYDNTISGLLSEDVQHSIDELSATKLNLIEKGQPNGIASLDSNGLVPSTQLPSYVDDVIEVATYTDLPVTGETGKIYVVIADETSNGDTSTYRWTGTVYAMVSNTLNAADVKALYESNSDTNAYTDNEKLEVAASTLHNTSDGSDHTFIDQDVTTTAIPTFAGIVTEGLVDGRDVSVDGAKLDTIEEGATGDQTADEILTLLKTVDGSGSELDADLLDGQEGEYYLNASNINAGIINDARLPDTITSSITGNAATATKLATARTIALTGDVSGSVNFNGSGNVNITTTVADDSHNHVISNVDGLQDALDSKANQSDTYTKTEVDGFINTLDSTTVKLTGNQTIAGVKTFSSGIVGNVTGNLSGNAGTSDKWTTARTITLSGDVTGSASVDGSANVTMTTTIEPNSVALGTDTTGNYMVNVTAGSGISVSHTPGEGSTATITNSAPNVTTNITTTHNSANVIVNSSDGTDGTINSATQTLAGVMSATDKTKLDGIEEGATADQTAEEIKSLYESNANTNALTDALLTLLTTNKVKNVSTDSLNNKLVITYTDDTVSNLNINDIITDIHVSGASLDATSNILTLTSTDGGADVTVDLSDFVNSTELTTALTNHYTKNESNINFEPKNANIQSHISNKSNPHSVTKTQVGLGNVDNTADSVKVVASAGKWTTARTLSLTGDVTGSVNFDGSGNVTIATTVQPNSVALGTDTTGNYVAGATAGTGISISGTAGEGWSPTITNTAPNVTTNITTTHNATNVVVNSSDGTDGTINAATTSLAGVMTGADKTKLDGIETNAKDDQVASEVPVTPKGNLSSNQVQSALEEIMDKIYDTKEW